MSSAKKFYTINEEEMFLVRTHDTDPSASVADGIAVVSKPDDLKRFTVGELVTLNNSLTPSRRARRARRLRTLSVFAKDPTRQTR
jgi:hypothetical protein